MGLGARKRWRVVALGLALGSTAVLAGVVGFRSWERSHVPWRTFSLRWGQGSTRFARDVHFVDGNRALAIGWVENFGEADARLEKHLYSLEPGISERELGDVQAFSPRTGRVLLGAPPEAVVLEDPGEHLWVWSIRTGKLELEVSGWRLVGFSRASELITWRAKKAPGAIEVHTAAGTVRVLDHGVVGRVMLSASGDRLATTELEPDPEPPVGAGPPRIVVRDVSTGATVWSHVPRGAAASIGMLAIAPEGDRLAVVSASGVVDVWELPP